jgi:hypothetical protein
MSKSLVLKNIGKGSKLLVNLYDIFRNSAGSECRAKNLILIKRSINAGSLQDSNLIDLALFNRNQNLIEALCQHDGIVLTDTFIENDYVIYRFSLSANKEMTKRFQSLCREYEDDIFFQEKVDLDKSDYTSKPEISLISQSAAALEMLKSLRNRSPESRLLKRFNGQNSQLLLTIGSFLKDINCYEMKIGRLNEMADIIDELSP